jgi:hypothetical protein
MASLLTENPHNKPKTCECTKHKVALLPLLPRTMKIFEHTRGQPISNRSKKSFELVHNSNTLPLADVRLLMPPATPQGLVNLEFFFDGEVKDLTSEAAFVEAVIAHVTQMYAASVRPLLTQAIQDGNRSKIDEIKTMKILIQPFIPNTIRDAGCMLRFVAVRLSLEHRIAAFVGREVFPEEFGGEADAEDDRPLPRWFSLLVLACLVAFLAVVFAWGNILMKAIEK